MTKRWMAAVLMCALLATTTLVASAQPSGGTIRILVADETKTFASTMRVAGLVGALRKVPIFQVGVVLSDATDWEDPLAGQVNEDAPYDLVILLPRGLDSGSAYAIWVVSGGIGTLGNDVAAAIGIVTEIAGQVFSGAAPVKGVNDDLFPAVLWGLYVTKGWMR